MEKWGEEEGKLKSRPTECGLGSVLQRVLEVMCITLASSPPEAGNWDTCFLYQVVSVHASSHLCKFPGTASSV